MRGAIRNPGLRIADSVVGVALPLVLVLTAAWLLGTPAVQMPDKLSLQWLMEITTTHWQPLYAGSLFAGIVLATTGYFATLLYWRWWVSRNWRRRQQNRHRHRGAHLAH